MAAFCSGAGSVRPATGRAFLVRTPSMRARCLAVAAPRESAEGQVQEITSHEFRTFLECKSARVAVVDFYTTWCGPCKMVAPQLDLMAEEFAGQVRFAKINLVTSERVFAKEMGITALPTFHIYIDGKKTEEVIGARADKLKNAVAKYAQTHARR